jgi:ABC-type transporter Mla subunit MlaD
VTREAKWQKAVAVGEARRDEDIDSLIDQARQLARELRETIGQSRDRLRETIQGERDEPTSGGT